MDKHSLVEAVLRNLVLIFRRRKMSNTKSVSTLMTEETMAVSQRGRVFKERPQNNARLNEALPLTGLEQVH